MGRRLLALAFVIAGVPLSAQVSYDRLYNAAKEPKNWLMYSGTYAGHRYSSLSEINLTNVNNLELKWVFQSQTPHNFQATPLVVDGIMYVTQPPNDVVALDAKNGRVFWVYQYTPSALVRVCCSGRVNRGLAILGETLFMATIDAHLVAVDAKNGVPLWASGLDEKGWPVFSPQPPGAPTYPSVYGATNWYSPSYSPPYAPDVCHRVGGCRQRIRGRTERVQSGSELHRWQTGLANSRRSEPRVTAPRSRQQLDGGIGYRRRHCAGPANWNPQVEVEDTRRQHEWNPNNASDLLFVGSREGYFQALDARTGKVLRKVILGWHATAAPITYELAGRQYVGMSAGRCLFVFGLRN